MKSFGLYYKGDKPSEDAVEIHVNLWKIKSFNVPYLLDFGLMISQSVKSIALFLPFKLNSNEKKSDFNPIKDLGHILMENKDILSLVFNTRMQITNPSNGVYAKATDDEKGESFYIYKLGPTNFNCDTTKFEAEGTLLTIDLKSEPNDKNFTNDIKNSLGEKQIQVEEKKEKVYLRFRIEVPSLDNIKIKDNLSNDIIQSAFSKIELYDFRINDLRQYDAKIDEAIKTEGFTSYTFEKIHFLYMVNNREVIQDMNTMHKDCRFLEKSKWGDYLPNGINDINFISYHWKKTKDKTNFSDFSLFFSATYPSRNWIQLLVSLDFIILLGFIGSFLCTKFLDTSKLASWNYLDYVWFFLPLILLLCLFLFFVPMLWNKTKSFLHKKIAQSWIIL